MGRFHASTKHHAERTVPFGAAFDASVGKSFPRNYVTTSKYTWLSFLPLVTFEQFQKRANVYFTFICILMYLGEHTPLIDSSVSWWSTACVLIPMMAMSMVISGLDDARRHQSDRQMNNQRARAIRIGGSYGVYLDTVLWKDILVGDILVLKSEEELPADLIPLACAGQNGQCYVSTANLDGETNLKIKNCLNLAQACLCSDDLDQDGPPLLDQAIEKLPTLHGLLHIEAPSKSINKFSGSAELENGDTNKESLSAANLLLRGTQLRNTAWLFGVVVYTGPQTRMAMNSRETPTKLANLEQVVNRAMLVVLGAQAVLAMLSSVLYVAHEGKFKSLWYLYPPNTFIREGLFTRLVMNWFKFFILYSNLMPISLYAAMEICNFFQAYFVKSDLAMYDEDQDCPAAVRSTNLCHELGQISYIFSDKTGTLTQNVMELKRIAVLGQVFGEVTEQRGFSQVKELQSWAKAIPQHQMAVDAFLEVLAIAHTVMIATNNKGDQCFEAESPDEGALVEGAQQLGWTYVHRSGDAITVELAPSTSRRYAVLAVNSFNSTRKRMSTVARAPDGRLWLWVKGADNVMIARAAAVPGWINESLSNFSKDGLRTLVLGRRALDPAEAEKWLKAFEAAQCSLEDREDRLEELAEQIEVNLELLGVTGIEDKLQVGVPDTIEKLREAGIQLWVLTGDKLETARNIGFSTRLLSTSMDIAVLTGEENLEESLQEIRLQHLKAKESGLTCALMVTGLALEHVTAQNLSEDFFEVSKNCSVVVACRVSPLQKSQLVRMVRESEDPQPITLAIGDGANDVPMIQEAHVGVGVSGKEGRQAVNAADFSIAQFRFLERLLLVHGRWDYRRACKFILYTFWKNAIITMLLFYYTFFSGYSGTCMFTSTVWTSFSMILFWPVIATTLFDRDVTDAQAVKYPALYETGRLGLDLNLTKMIEMLLSAFVHSMVIMTVAVVSVGDLDIGATGSYYSFSFMIFSWVVVTMNYRAIFITTTYNWVFVASLVASFATYLLFAIVYCQLPSFFPEVYQMLYHVMQKPIFWTGGFVVPLLAMMIDIFKAYLMLEFFPDTRDLILESSVKGELSTQMRRVKSEILPATGSRDILVPRLSGMVMQMLFCWNGTNACGTSNPPLSHSWQPSAQISSSFAFNYPEGMKQVDTRLNVRSTSKLDTSLLDTAERHRDPSASSSSVSDTESVSSSQSSITSVKHQRPSSTPFAQQTMRSVQFVLSWKMVFLSSSIIGILFCCMGLGTLLVSLSASQLRILYDGPANEIDGRSSSWDFMGQNVVLPCHAPSSCTYTMKLPIDLEPPIQVYYEVKPFWQNYFSYMSSVVRPQLHGHLAQDQALQRCAQHSRVTSSGEEIFPCGLMATSVFNDTFAIRDTYIDTESPQMPIWRHFENPPEYLKEPGFSWLYERYPKVTSRDLGVRSKRFIAWMCPNFLNRASKPYGVISEHLKKGSIIDFVISSSFPVEQLGARKTVLLTRGTQNYTLAVVLLVSHLAPEDQRSWKRQGT
ncbi:unnamed protein product [Durusdinium trenchii]|uniref:Phospholipid-transporting ATPase n=1 Tax=Durusdinium trenchii TaxID=1381693 RepID=A0ABP0JX60_9DINO